MNIVRLPYSRSRPAASARRATAPPLRLPPKSQTLPSPLPPRPPPAPRLAASSRRRPGAGSSGGSQSQWLSSSRPGPRTASGAARRPCRASSEASWCFTSPCSPVTSRPSAVLVSSVASWEKSQNQGIFVLVVLNCNFICFIHSGPNCISPFKAQESELADISTKLLLHYSPKVLGLFHLL